MNARRFALAATILAMLCGTAGAETVSTTNSDPFAVPVSVPSQAGERAATSWTAERRAAALPTLVPEVDPAAVSAASERLRSATGIGPEGIHAALVLVADDGAPIGAMVNPGGENAADYWTPERLRGAKPMPMLVIPDGALHELIKPGPKNR